MNWTEYKEHIEPHQYETTRIRTTGLIEDICRCGFKVCYHTGITREERQAEQAMRVHLA